MDDLKRMKEVQHDIILYCNLSIVISLCISICCISLVFVSLSVLILKHVFLKVINVKSCN